MIRLGVNIDHIATVRQARGEKYPSPTQAAVFAELGGADNITCHLREDRRHIQDRDVFSLKESINIPLNFEMAATEEMMTIARKVMPHAVTLVPERRAEVTTEGGLNLDLDKEYLKSCVGSLQDLGIAVSLFVEPSLMVVEQAKKIGSIALEFHTGRFCREIDLAATSQKKSELVKALVDVSIEAKKSGFQCHFGHGLNYSNAFWLQMIPHAEEANIGHAIIGRALFCGLEQAVRQMKDLLNDPSNLLNAPQAIKTIT
jgi:pyridoxine 5-phosphate synthase